MVRPGLLPPQGRRFRLLDVTFLIALLALPMAAIAAVLRSNLSLDAQMFFTIIALAAPAVVLLSWLLTEPGVLRSRWGEGPVLAIYVGLSLVAIVLVLVLYALHPVGALLVGAKMLGLLIYLLTWL